MMLSVKLFNQIHQPRPRNIQRKHETRSHSTQSRGVKVTVVGAAGGIGQPLSLLLKQNPQISMLALHDVRNVKGVAADLSHICTPTSVCSFTGDGELFSALEDAAIVVVPAGLPRKPGMKRTDLLGVNASVAVAVAKAISVVCPAALLAFITNPVNTIVPIVAQVLRQEDAFDPNRLFGVTTLDVVRAKTLIGERLGVNPLKVSIPVVGGHAGTTILPLVSQCRPRFECSDEERAKLVKRVQEAGTEVVAAKAGQGSATLSMAYSAAHFVNALLRAMDNEENVIECAYVQSDVTEADFFASPILLGPRGIQKNLGLPDLDEIEEQALESLMVQLKKDIEEAAKYVTS